MYPVKEEIFNEIDNNYLDKNLKKVREIIEADSDAF